MRARLELSEMDLGRHGVVLTSCGLGGFLTKSAVEKMALVFQEIPQSGLRKFLFVFFEGGFDLPDEPVLLVHGIEVAGTGQDKVAVGL